MKYNIVIAGVGGQGIIAVAAVIARAAMLSGLLVRQSEIHGMSQRGGGVSSFVRISDAPIPSDIIPNGGADMILSMEPLESLRYIHMLAENGILITAKEPFKNIPDYTNLDGIYNYIKSIERNVIVDTEELAKEAGAIRSANIVLVGAAAPHLPIEFKYLEQATAEIFAKKGDVIVAANLNALHIGRQKGAGVVPDKE